MNFIHKAGQSQETPDKFKKTWKKTVTRKEGLAVWKHKTKLGGKHKKVAYGKKVNVMVTKDWYCKVLLADGRVGYMNKKYLK